MWTRCYRNTFAVSLSHCLMYKIVRLKLLDAFNVKLNYIHLVKSSTLLAFICESKRLPYLINNWILLVSFKELFDHPRTVHHKRIIIFSSIYWTYITIKRKLDYKTLIFLYNKRYCTTIYLVIYFMLIIYV